MQKIMGFNRTKNEHILNEAAIPSDFTHAATDAAT